MDIKTEKLVPEVRFKGFTDDWEQRKLNSIAHQTFGGGTPSKSNKQFWNGDFPWIQSSDLAEDTIRGVHPNKFITQNALLISAAKKIPKNSIAIVSRVGVGKVALIPFNYSTSQDFLSLSSLKINSQFATYSIHKIMKKTASQLQGTSIKGITKKDILNKTIIFPISEKEQVHISSLLKYVDYIISLQQRKLEQLKRLKKAMLQQLFANNNSKQPNLRFKNFKGDWEQCKLGELIESLFQGINTAADKVEYSNNGLPIIQAKNITSGSLDFSGSRKLSVQKYSNYLDKYIPQKGDILFANIGTIGPNVILKDTRQFFIAWNILRIVPQKNINGEFLKITLDLLNSKHYFEKLLTGNATKFVNKNDMRNLPIFFSDPEEQNKISNLFKKLDFLITLQQNKLTQLTILKKYLLQKMFI